MAVFTVRVTVRDRAGATASRDVQVEERAPQPGMLLGMTSSPGAPHNAMMARWPNIAYTADFGNDGPDADNLPELPNPSAGKLANPGPVPATLGISWKDDVAQLDAWLDAYGQAGGRPFYLHWRHEPHGDISPADYRPNAAAAVDIITREAYRDLVLGFGPVVTRWWMINDGGDLADWWVDGMTHYAADVYNDAMDRYRPPTEWGPKIRDFAVARGATWGVREWGKKRINGDTAGAGRCAAIRADVQWCAANGCRYMGWWNFGDTQPSSKIFGTGTADATYDAERNLFDELLAAYDPRGHNRGG